MSEAPGPITPSQAPDAERKATAVRPEASGIGRKAFCSVVIPRTRLDELTYEIPAALQEKVKIGSAVKVELVHRTRVGVVVDLPEHAGVEQLKPVIEVVEPEFCDPGLVRLTRWVSQYYAASWGETLTLAFPGGIFGYRPRKAWDQPLVGVPTGTAPTLTLEQSNAAQRIRAALNKEEYKAFLLFGVTGSGKTEIYLRAAEEARRLGKTVVVLVPEIALTPLLLGRFQERFPTGLVALHSGLRPSERKKFWQALRNGQAGLVVGARSAVFAPVRNLGLIVVDEEHDASYKEQDRSPHYNARDVAVMRAKQQGAVVVLASATPGLESFHNAQSGAYELLDLPSRIAQRPLAKTMIVNMRGQRLRQVFAPVLEHALRQRLESREQAILFVNRRGFARQVVCRDCGHVPTCRHCEMPLVYHADTRDLQCHFCQIAIQAPDECPNCRSHEMDPEGVGTQQVVQALRRLLAGVKVLRLDSDVRTRPDACRQVLNDFARGGARFLVGTQMVTKGFDFPDVTLAAAVAIDSMLHMPDFRAGERVFQTLTQVAGRAGRGEKAGQAIFQTLHPRHHAVVAAARQDYVAFYQEEIALRQELRYPPFTRLALVRIMSSAPLTLSELMVSKL
ncbi:MAG: primosomal protein N', partial [candidate division WOR-3 bacterium]